MNSANAFWITHTQTVVRDNFRTSPQTGAQNYGCNATLANCNHWQAKLAAAVEFNGKCTGTSSKSSLVQQSLLLLLCPATVHHADTAREKERAKQTMGSIRGKEMCAWPTGKRTTTTTPTANKPPPPPLSSAASCFQWQQRGATRERGIEHGSITGANCWPLLLQPLLPCAFGEY